MISSSAAANQTFQNITFDPTGFFKLGSFYTFFYDYGIRQRCVAHGARSDFVGMTLDEVFETVNIDLDAEDLHRKFAAAARAGGGWVQCESNSSFVCLTAMQSR